MTTAFQIPLSPDPQRLTVQLGGTDYDLRVVWNTTALCWVLDIAAANGVPLVQALPIVTGLDILAQHKHLGIAGALVAQTDYDTDAVPSYFNLGITGRLYFVREP